MQPGAQTLRERAQQVIQRGEQCQADRPAVDAAVIAEEFAEQGQQDQHDGERVQEHQHGERIGDDGAQAEVREHEGHDAEDHRPDGVFRPAGEDG